MILVFGGGKNAVQGGLELELEKWGGGMLC